jgi:hypothetical protein
MLYTAEQDKDTYMNGEQERIRKEGDASYFEMLTRHSPECPEESCQKARSG